MIHKAPSERLCCLFVSGIIFQLLIFFPNTLKKNKIQLLGRHSETISHCFTSHRIGGCKTNTGAVDGVVHWMFIKLLDVS